MSLSTHINAEKVLKASREHSHKHGRPSIHELMSRDKPGHYDLPPVSYLAARGLRRPPLALHNDCTALHGWISLPRVSA
jgi:hypothetical protein